MLRTWPLWLLLFLARSVLGTSSVNFVPSSAAGTASSCTPTNGCPNLDFTWHAANTGTMVYNIEVTSVSWEVDNIYAITIHVTGAKSIPIEDLWSAKIIGVSSPDGSTFQLYGHNENVYLIDDPTNYFATFRVYGVADSTDSSKVWMPNFQIQYEYLQGSTATNAAGWTYGTTTFDLITGCNNYDNQGHSQTDSAGFYWSLHCSSGSSIS